MFTEEILILQRLDNTSIKCNLTQDEAITARVPAASLSAEELSIRQRCASCWESHGTIHTRKHILKTGPFKGLESRWVKFLCWADRTEKKMFKRAQVEKWWFQNACRLELFESYMVKAKLKIISWTLSFKSKIRLPNGLVHLEMSREPEYIAI